MPISSSQSLLACYAKSAGGLAAGRLETKRTPNSQRAGHDYVLGEALKHGSGGRSGCCCFSILAPAFGYLAGGTDFSGTNEGKCGRCGQHGRIASLGNAAGRVFGHGFDLITRRSHSCSCFILQVLLFWFLPSINTASLMTIVTFVVLMCYGGGFGTCQRLPLITLVAKNVGPIYGYVDRLELCQRGRSVVHRADARNSRFLCGGPSRYCCGDGNFNSAAVIAATRASVAAGAAAQRKFA